MTPEEAVEQAKLREEYIEGYRRSVRHHIEGIKMVDEEGNDVTPGETTPSATGKRFAWP